MSKSQPFSVDKALDSIDYTFPGYSPSEESLEFFNLMRLVQGKDFEFNTPLAHYFMADVLFGNVTADSFPYSDEVRDTINVNVKRVAIMASRGLAKSTVVTTFMPVYLAIKGKLPKYGKVYFMLGIAASAQSGGRVMCKAIQSLCQDSVFCNEYFETMRFTETESELTRKGKGSLDDRTFLFRAIGFSGGIRGTRSNVGAHRVDIIAFDDTILNTASAYSKTQMDMLENIMSSDAENALVGGGKGRVWVVFTPFHAGDPNYKLISGGAYTPVVLPIAEKVDDSSKVNNIRSAWTDMHPVRAILDQYQQAKAANKLQSFMQERMLRVTSEEERMVPDHMINWYDNSADILNKAQNFTVLITTDFTASNSMEGDYSGIAAWAISPSNQKFLVMLYLEKTTIQGQFDALFQMVSKLQFMGVENVEVGVEIDGQQQVNIYALEKMMIEKNVWFRFARQKGKAASQKGIRSRSGTSSKLDRFRSMLPEFEMGRILFPKNLQDTPPMIEMMDELKKAAHGGFGSLHDDACDLISQLGMIDYIPPTGDTQIGKQDELPKASGIWGGDIDIEDSEEDYGNSTVF